MPVPRKKEAVVIYRKIKNNDGFTLLEVIISIAALSFLSIFILQMFMASSNLNNRAKDSDIAMTKAISGIENFKKHQSLSAYKADDNIGSITETGDIMTVSYYYDETWNLMETDGTDIPTDARYSMIIEINADDEPLFPQKEGVTYGELYIVKAGVVDMSSGKDIRTLALLKSKKYFSGGFEGM